MSPQPPPNFPDLEGNIMNKRGGPDSSLYQICMNLRTRLATVPGFEGHIAEMEEEEADTADSIDPVTLMWNSLRRGYPLMTVYNASRPPKPVTVDTSKVKEKDIPKAATFQFLQACMRDLQFQPSECFLITDLYGEDTTGFVKVTKVVNRVLDILSDRRILRIKGPSRSVPSDDIPQHLSPRQHIIDEIVKTERDYVQQLETLQHFQNGVQTSGAIPGDAVHDIFLNLNALLDFQRRFLIRIEQQNSLSESEQNWGKLFSHYKDSFRVYEPFLANQSRSSEVVLSRWKELQKAGASQEFKGMLETPAILLGFLVKPFQRLAKYPLLLHELVKNGEYDAVHLADLAEGKLAAKLILERADEAIGKQHRTEALSELQGRVEDWKGHKIDHFGDLLLFGSYTVLKGEGAKEVEREVSTILSSLDPKTRELVRKATQSFVLPRVDCEAVLSQNTKLPPLRPPRTPREHPSWSSLELPDIVEEEEAPRSAHQVSLNEDIDLVIERLEKTRESPRTSRQSSRTELSMSSSLQASPRVALKISNPSTPTTATAFSRKPSRTDSFDSPGKSSQESPSPSDTLVESLILSGVDDSPRWITLPGSPRSPLSGSKPRLAREASRFSPLFRKFIPSPTSTGPQILSFEGQRCRDSICHPEHLDRFNGVFAKSTYLLHHHDAFFPPVPDSKNSVGPVILPMEKDYIEKLKIDSPVRVQYKVYLFERILLCCKEINPNKPKNKMLGTNKPLVDKKGKLKLQLKGRIFMQNVTDVVTLKNKEVPSYTIQIFWKGDPGVENFVIRFADEKNMKMWQEAVQRQKKVLTETARGSGQTGTSATQFTYLDSQPTVVNPYRAEEEDDDDDMQSSQIMAQGKSHFAVSRNASSTSLRSTAGPPGRMAPPKSMPQEHGNVSYTPSLSLNTNVPPGGPSPGEFVGNSYFSPSNDSPISTRSSSQQSMYPLSRYQTPGGGWTHDENKHRTAPAMGRAPSRDGSGAPNSYVLNGKTVTRPSLPVMAASQYSQQQLGIAQSRLRSASTPDIHNHASGTRRPGNGQLHGPPENVPVPPIPAHMAQMRAPVNRSQTTSPVEGQLPFRSANQSPSQQRDRHNRQYQDQASYDRQGQRLPPTSDPYLDNPMQSSQNAFMRSNEIENGGGVPYPTQLKVTIWFDPKPSHVTIVVPIIIKHRSLIDRIDSKMVKVSSASIARGSARLRYRDSDGDLITIRSDEDVHLAIEDWGTSNEPEIRGGVVPDFELHWQQN